MLCALTSNNALAQDDSRNLTFRLIAGKSADASDIEQVCCNAYRKPVLGSKTGKFATKYGAPAYWLKIEGITGDGLVHFSPILDDVTLYARTKGQSDWQTARTGDTVANSEKPFATPFMALPLPDKVDTAHVYARILQPTAVTIRARFWSLPPFIAMQDSDRTIKTFLLGFISSIILYNTIVSLLVRDLSFFLNAVCVFSLLVMSLYLSGYGVTYIWAPWFDYSNVIFFSSVWAGVVFGSALFYSFLKVPEKPAKSYWPLFLSPALAIAAAIIFGVMRTPYWMMQGAMVICAALLFVGALPLIIRAALAGEKRAQIFFVPLSLAMFPGLLALSLDKIAGIRLFNLGNNTVELMLALEAMLFSLALAFRIRITESDNQESARRLLELRERNSAIALSAQDNERKRLASELHDGVGHDLLLLIISLKKLVIGANTNNLARTVSEMVKMASEVMKNLRRISHDMHPASIEHLGLGGTIQELAQQLNHTGQIDVRLNLALDGFEFNPQAQLHLVRIVQECLANVAKHSDATKCVINMEIHTGKLKVQIEDDGIGLESLGELNQNHFGLGMTSINERVRGLGGEWAISKSLLGGLMTSIVIPVVNISSAGEVRL